MFSNSFKQGARVIGMALAFAFSSGAVHAAPIDVFFNGSVVSSGGNYYGLSAQSQADFLAAGGQVQSSWDSLELVLSRLDITNPGDITTNYVAGGPDFVANPARDENDWVIQANEQLDDVWIVFRGHDPTDPLGINNTAGGYLPQNVGLTLDPTGTSQIWRMVNSPAMGGDPATSYLALYLGDLAQDDIVTELIRYSVTQGILSSGDLQFPKYLVGLMFAAVPEAGTVLLLVTTGLGLMLRRRLA
ncbi:MAG: hypothetical protein GY723_14575 [bacterium]|nr:hypothetical protein [bacterium]